jgi:lipopolysaccharide export system permease protein
MAGDGVSKPYGAGVRGVRLIDRYLLHLAVWPMLGALAVTLVALLLERVLRLLDLLADSSSRFGFVAELAANLVPHYLGLTLPAAFFVSLFIVFSRLSDGSEIDAFLASGVSLSRLASPFIYLGMVLAVLSLMLFGYMQPYSRYAYRAVLHAAVEAGWNGRLSAQTFVSPGQSVTMTADIAEGEGRRLQRVFIRKTTPDGREEITTAKSAALRPTEGGGAVAVILENGQQLNEDKRGDLRILSFQSFVTQVPLAGAQKLLRDRGGDTRELTLAELWDQANSNDSLFGKQALLAELYGRLARALALPLLPLLALPLSLAAKRGGRVPGVIVAGLTLIAFHHLLQFGQSLAEQGVAPAYASVGLPTVLFAAICLFMFLSSRKRPGETPLSLLSEHLGDIIHWVAGQWRRPQAPVRP